MKPQRLAFFLDRSFPSSIAKGVRVIFGGRQILEIHDEAFGQTTPDTEWIEALSDMDPKPFVISGDGYILRNPEES